MGDDRKWTKRADEREDDKDDLCDAKTVLGDDEITKDEDLPEATGDLAE